MGKGLKGVGERTYPRWIPVWNCFVVDRLLLFFTWV